MTDVERPVLTAADIRLRGATDKRQRLLPVVRAASPTAPLSIAVLRCVILHSDISGRIFDMPSRRTIADCAIELHRTGRPDLACSLAPDFEVDETSPPAGYRISGGTLTFDSLADRNAYAAAQVYAGLREGLPANTSDLFDAAYGLWRDEIGHADQASGRLLALASECVDIVALATNRIQEGSDVFDALHLVEAALPYLDQVKNGSLIDLFAAKVDRTRGDMAAGVINGAVESWLGGDAQRSLDLHACLQGELSEASASLLGNCVVALAHSDFARAVAMARDAVASTEELRRNVGVWILGRLLAFPAPATERQAVVDDVNGLLESKDAARRSRAAQAATSAMHLDDAFDDALGVLAQGGDADVLTGIAGALFLQVEDMLDRGGIGQWLPLLAGLGPDSSTGLHSMDNAMARLLTQPAHASVVIETLTDWVARHGEPSALDKRPAKLFSRTF